MSDKKSRRDLLLGSAAVTAFASLYDVSGKSQQNSTTSGKTIGNSKANKDVAKIIVSSTIDDEKQQILKALPATDTASPLIPYTRDPQQWAALRNRSTAYYGINADNEIVPVLNTPISAGFRFVTKDEDLLFHFQDVDILLNRSADLFERAYSTCEKWYALQSRAYNVAIELQQFFYLDEIHQDEIDAGCYTHAADEADRLFQAELDNEASIDALGDLTKQIRKNYYSQTNIDSQSSASQLLSWLSQVEADTQTETQALPGGFSTSTSSVTRSFNGQIAAPSELAMQAASTLSYNALYLQQASVDAQISAMARNSAVSAQKTQAADRRRRWETANSDFRKRRSDVSRRLADEKAAAYTTPGGPLNYPERMKQLAALFFRDFRDALAMMQAATEGLVKIYGFAEPLPGTVVKALAGDEIAPECRDDCLRWVRDAISYLVKFVETDQRYSLPVSVKTQVGGKSAFDRGKSISGYATWTFPVPRELFPDQYYIRLRGASVYVVGKELNGVWTAIIKPPASSFYEHRNRTVDSVTRVDVLQDDLPSARSGRISIRESVRNPDVLGVSALNNASPISTNNSTWTVQVSQVSSENVSIDRVEDVVLELHLAMRVVA